MEKMHIGLDKLNKQLGGEETGEIGVFEGLLRDASEKMVEASIRGDDAAFRKWADLILEIEGISEANDGD